jgi:hypothetical protein
VPIASRIATEPREVNTIEISSNIIVLRVAPYLKIQWEAFDAQQSKRGDI